MFKYGSLRQFLLKFFSGVFILGLSTVYFVSLITHNASDKAFGVTGSKDEIQNYFGYFGSNLSNISINIIGDLSFLLSLFLLLESIKLILGIKNKYLVLRLITITIGIIIINLVFDSYKFYLIDVGVLSNHLRVLLEQAINNYFDSWIIVNLVNIIFFIFGLLLIIFSFSIKLNFIKKILFQLKYLKFLKYVFFVLSIFKVLKFRKKENRLQNKNEPTITNKKTINKEPIINKKKVSYKQQEMEEFEFSLPKKSFLLRSAEKNNSGKEINKINSELAVKLEKTLSEYGVEGKIVGYKSGPIVTLFEFVPNAGIKSSKIIALSDDIARAMSSLSARISSQPGKTSLGIEIPNLKRDNVLFGDLIEEEKFQELNDSITLALGKDISGEKIFADLEKMPHLLIAGTTGSGKSVGINTMILSILYRFKPNECKLILIDPKMLELSVYEDIPHLLTPVVTDPKKAVFALKWVVREMENRYKLMSSLNVKNIQSYNNKVEKTLSTGRKLYREVQTGIDSDTRMPILEKIEIKLERMPLIVVVIDEMADLMMVAGKEVETLVQRLAQMARASGIHLITATQRPSVDVITGTIKANFPSRISYKVASKFDSRTILNEMGAEQLLGSGDMLLLENGGSIKRLHGGFISENEVEKVVASIKNQATFDYKKEISLEDIVVDQKIDGDLVSGNNDELYNKAVEIIIKQQKVSTSYIQRYLQIGYNRAARIIEKMEEDGIITEANNAGKRHVLKKN